MSVCVCGELDHRACKLEAPTCKYILINIKMAKTSNKTLEESTLIYTIIRNDPLDAVLSESIDELITTNVCLAQNSH